MLPRIIVRLDKDNDKDNDEAHSEGRMLRSLAETHSEGISEMEFRCSQGSID